MALALNRRVFAQVIANPESVSMVELIDFLDRAIGSAMVPAEHNTQSLRDEDRLLR